MNKAKILRIGVIIVIAIIGLRILFIGIEWGYSKRQPSVSQLKEFMNRAMHDNPRVLEEFKKTSYYTSLKNAQSVDSLQFYFEKYKRFGIDSSLRANN